MKKKIIFVTKALWIGGIETALVNLLKQFDYEKYDVTLLVLRAELDMLDQIHPKCRVLIADREKTVTFSEKYRYSRLFHLTEKPDRPSGFHKMMMWTVPAIRWLENWLYIRYIRKLMRGEEFATAVIYSDVAGETAVRAIKAKKYLMFYHHGAMRHVYHDKIAYRKCDKIIAVSENLAEALRKFNPKYSNKITAVHNLTDIEGIRRKGQELIPDHFDSRKLNIVSVGRVSHEKGMDLAVRACARLVKNGYNNVRWWIVGDGPAMQEVKTEIERLHMEAYVITVGMKTNPYPYIQHADLYVQPSRFEGYPMTILEALILGKVVVSTNNPGAAEIIDDEKNGVLCDPSVDSIVKKIERLIQNAPYFSNIKKVIEKTDFIGQNQQSIYMFKELL